MSEAKSVATHMFQWITDGQPCEQAALHDVYRSLTVEVKGDLNGESVEFYGGITPGDLAFIAHARLSPWLEHLPAVLFIQPVTKAVGVTITIRGIV
jgi:hypothetical protein